MTNEELKAELLGDGRRGLWSEHLFLDELWPIIEAELTRLYAIIDAVSEYGCTLIDDNAALKTELAAVKAYNCDED